MAFENLSDGSKGALMLAGGVGLVFGSLYLGDKFDPWEDTESNAAAVGEIPAAPSVDANTGVQLDFTSIPGLDCIGPVVPISVDARADIGTTTSLLKAIELNRPGSSATQMDQATVYALARAVAALNGHPELVSPTQLDDFPYGTYNIPTNCTANSTSGAPILAIVQYILMYPVNPNSYRPRRPSRWPYVAIIIGAAGFALPFVGDKILDFDKDDRQATAAAGNIPPAAAVTPLDQATMQAMRDSYPRDQVFIKNINGIDYAWPVGRPHRNLYKIALPCELEMLGASNQSVPNINPATMCHADPGKLADEGPGAAYATDFVYRDPNSGDPTDTIIGEPVRAITDGTIVEIDQGDTPNCSDIKLQSIDGYFYWYAHAAANPLVSENQTVSAGQEIGAVGGPECAGGGVPHVHNQRSTVWDAYVSNRDPGYIALMTDLFVSLPE